jgi:hypothetical protein
MHKALAKINALPGSSWLPAADKARSEVIGQLTPLTATIDSADVAAATAPAMLGANGIRSYMITFENDAELRATGGLPGAFAIMKADHGKLTFTKFEPDDTLVDVKSGLNLGADFNQTYDSADATGDYRDSNVSPNFAYAARIWLAEWKVKTGQQLDGALAIDPTALGYLLDVTGPATLPDGSTVTGSNVVQLTQQTAYSKFTDGQNGLRKLFLLDIARSVSTRLISDHGTPTSLVRAAGKAASEHRLLIWSSDPKIENRLADTSIGGAVPVTSKSFALVALNNAGANKLDYYLHASMGWVATGCGSRRKVTVTITLTNLAPQHPPNYVLGFTGKPGFPQIPGDNEVQVSYYGTAGGFLASAYLNGTETGVSSGRELGHPVYTLSVPIAHGATSTLILNLTESGSGKPTLRLQPMVNPMTAQVTAHSCG